MNAATDSPVPACRPWGRRFAAFLLLAIRQSSRWLIRILFSAFILLALLFAYLHRIGVPAYLADGLLDRLARRGYHLQIDRLTLEIDRGLVARNVRMYATALEPEPFLTAEALTVALQPGALLRRRQIRPVLAITNGLLRANLGQGRFGARQGSRSIMADQINFRVSASDREMVLRDFNARFLGIGFRGRGAIYFPPPIPGDRMESTPAPDHPLAPFLQAMEHAPDRLLQIVEQINAISFAAPPSADFTFAIYLPRLETSTVTLRIHAPSGGRVQGIEVDGFHAEATWKNQQLHLPDLQLRKGSNVLGLSGWLSTTNQMISLHAVNTIPVEVFLGLLPEAAQRRAQESVAHLRFPLRLDLQIGPAPLASALDILSGSLALSDARILDVPIERLELAFARDHQAVRVDHAQLQLDSGPTASRLEIRDGSFQLDTRRFRAQVAGRINPHVVKPLLTPNMRAIVDWFDIREPIEGRVVVGGTAGDPAIYCYGPVQATNFAINKVDIQHLQGTLNITNEVMHITGATLTRPEGLARGDVHMAFSNQTLRLNVDSTLDPRAVTEMLGPVVADFMRPFQLNGPARIQAEGLLDYCNFSLNRLRAHIEAQRFGYDRWEADTAVFDLAAIGRRFRFTNAVATAYGGRIAGHGALYPVGSDLTWRYEMDFTAQGARLNDLLAASYGKPMGELRGTLDGTGVIGGYIGPGSGPSVVGTGQIDIRDGLLFQTRLFSGLTAVLAKILPDFNLFAQTDASGTYAIRNSRVYSRDILLQGSLFSVKASGHYSFAGDLYYRVEVQLLRGGPVATLVRLATRPVTRLLEFRLTGTFEDPRWRPVNLNPAELF